MSSTDILVVDDEKNIGRSLKLILSAEGYTVRVAENALEARREVQKNPPDIVFLDVLLPDSDGLQLLPEIRREYPQIEVIMISGHATLQMAVQATRDGAYDFLEKPLLKEKILLTLNHLAEKKRLENHNRQLREELQDEYRMVGESEVLQQVMEQIRKVAPTDSKVLILGESGTGKELVARAIHRQSARRDQPFVKMNCAAIPEELTESELFGHEKGAFTGAGQRREGKFHQAHRGTLFLDEVGDMSLRIQTKVLRVVEDGKFERVGSNETLSVDVRVIAATNQDLEVMVREGKFREDLYYRLHVFPVMLPPLRERPEDIPLLVTHFIQKYCRKNNRREVGVGPETMADLQAYSWPGNIRELQNLVERLIILNSGAVISRADIPDHLFDRGKGPDKTRPEGKSLKEKREYAERAHIRSCLEKCGWNVSRAARLLGVERTNLHKKMKALGIRRGEG